MRARFLPAILVSLVAALGACIPDAAGEWNGDLDLTGSTGSPPGSIAGNYAVSAAVTAAAGGDCGVRLDVTGVGAWERNDGVPCADGGFDSTFGATENLELTVAEVDSVHVTATAANKLTAVLAGSSPDWTCTFEGDASHSL